MVAVPDLDPAPAAHAPRIRAPALRRALLAGAGRVLACRETLNRINVFPVPDGDTGSNLAFTLGSVLGGSLSRRASSVGTLLRDVADDAIDGARGNSGAILAQFLHGASETAGNAHSLSPRDIAAAVSAGAEQARAALSEPREGTILSVIRAFAEALQVAPSGNLSVWFGQALEQARRALAQTPRQLAVLRQAGVVDAGAMGFVELLEGIHAFIATGDAGAAGCAADAVMPAPFAGAHGVEAFDHAHPWCTECIVAGEALDPAALRAAFAAIDAVSVVVAGGRERVRVHAHVASPAALFEVAGRFGSVTGRKADDMLAQHRSASSAQAVAVLTDSGADLPAAECERLGIAVVPVRVNFGDEDFLDKVSISTAEFYRRLHAGPALPKTSQPPPGDFRRQFEFLLSHHADVVYTGISRALSGTLQSGEHAAARAGAARIRVVDSGHASCGVGLIAMAAAEAARDGADAAAVAALATRLRGETYTWAVARDIRYGVRGGRVPRWAGPIVLALGVTPVAKMQPDGRLAIAGALWGTRNVPARFARYLAARLPRGQRWRVMVGHCDAAADGQALLDALRGLLDCEAGWLVEAGPAIGAHAGPQALVAAFQRRDR
ncbi:DegV family protein [Chiayiivirga flava]|uniref:DhaL domain-containing protein n=1 Tax=Chiayiivirga flava TaxID=659595 RepID=A0A7W8D8S0_9GAMM|nr:DegV family protein [Chiayiivirga flava]MBB5209697.1 hypothetical protein [Chiayiivirga flava]